MKLLDVLRNLCIPDFGFSNGDVEPANNPKVEFFIEPYGDTYEIASIYYSDNGKRIYVDLERKCKKEV